MIKNEERKGCGMDTRVLTAHVPKQLADKVDKLAEKLERSRGWIVKQALMDWIAKEEELHKLTLEALDDVDKGRVLPHEQVRAWVAGLPASKKKKR